MKSTSDGMGGHHSARAGKDEWLTPPEILKAVGPFDLDPCAPSVRPWDMAAKHISLPGDGLLANWRGRVWCNPPYGRATGDWLDRCVRHGNATALVFARTETDHWFRHVWPHASAILFLQGRLHFHHVDGRRAEYNSGAPSALVAFDGASAVSYNAKRLHNAQQIGAIPGKLIILRTGLAQELG
jgi:hypothetical protein